MDIPEVVLGPNDEPYRLKNVSVKSDGVSNMMFLICIYRKASHWNKSEAVRLRTCRKMVDKREDGIYVAWTSPRWADSGCKTIQVTFIIVPNKGRVLYG